MTGENSPDLTIALSEPFGLAPLSTVTEFWTPVEKNSRLVPLNSYFGLNRLVYGLVAIGLFLVTLSRFKRGMVKSKTKRYKGELQAKTKPISVMNITPSTSKRSDVTGFFTRLLFEYKSITKSVPFIILSLLALVLFVSNIYFATEFRGDTTLPTSATMATLVLGSFGLSILIISVFFGGDIMWRDRTVKIHEILDSTPVKNTTLVASKWGALGATILTLILMGIICGAVAQFIIGGTKINLGTYLQVGIGRFGIIMLMNASLVMFLQNFMPGRVIGMLVAAGAIIGFGLLTLTPFYHPLFDFNFGANMGEYSEINGFNKLTNFSAWMPYWSALILLFFISSIWLWRRGTETTLRSRIQGLKAQIGGATAALATLGIVSFIGFGGLIFKNYNIDQNYRNTKATEARLAAVEKFVKPFVELNTPKIRSVETNVSILNPQPCMLRMYAFLQLTAQHEIQVAMMSRN